MKYSINKAYYRTFSVFEKNKLAPRAYAVPYSDKTALANTSFKDERYSSDMVKVLSGDWNFKYYKSLKNLPDIIDTSKVKFDTVNVPFDWQRKGYEEPVYLNCPYEFKTMAPEIPEDMSAGVYRLNIGGAEKGKVYILSFLGVANNLSLYVNGKFAGYSEGSHNTAEFDITALMNEDGNELLAVSFKWCNGSFLEAQDMFRENGIFRDVLLTSYDETYLYDYKVTTQKKSDGYSLKLDTEIKGCTDNCNITAELCDNDGKTVAVKTVALSDNASVDFGTLDVLEWSAEIPNLYKLYITLEKDGQPLMTVRNYTGFRTIFIDKNIFRFNSQPVKLKGVNHHDTNLYNGYVMSHEDLIKDAELMKSLNVNAVRTSHYPPDPFFLIVADIYGLYIVDEADIETHGCWEMAGDINIISHDLKWAKHYVDRVKRMYYRDRNHPSIIMWSLGNEAGGYKCHDKCYKFLKSTGTEIPVHYEGVCRTKRFCYDVFSEMYTSTNTIEDMMNKKRIIQIDGKRKSSSAYTTRPFFLCEYCHAMGVGPGNLEEYWDLFYELDNSMGGCIWEWADHTVYHPGSDKKYKYRYTYGGDHGEKQHDGHFCVDGLMYSDRRLHTGAKEMKVVYRPLRATLAGNKLYCIENTNRFRDSSYIGIRWELLENGEKTDSGEITTAIPPMSAECFTIAHKDYDEARDCHINFIYTDTKTGNEIATEQLTLNDVCYEYDIEIGQKISAATENGMLTVNFENGSAEFDGRTGALVSYIINDKQLMNTGSAENSGFIPNVFRALIDNDACVRDEWLNSGLDKLKIKNTAFDVSLEDGEVHINSVLRLSGAKKALYEVSISYILSSFGAMEISTELSVLNENAPLQIPRFGLTAEFCADLDNVKYYGRGTAENMPDFKCQSPVGIYSAKVDDMFEKYVYPQESGMHCDTKWIELTDDNGRGIKIFADDALNFSVHHFTQNTLYKAQHQEDVKKADTTFVTLDGYTRGIGTSSCGPDTRAEYTKKASDNLSLSFTVIPV